MNPDIGTSAQRATSCHAMLPASRSAAAHPRKLGDRMRRARSGSIGRGVGAGSNGKRLDLIAGD